MKCAAHVNSYCGLAKKVLENPTRKALLAWAKTRHYIIRTELIQALVQLRRPLLLADVHPERAELTPDGGLQLGAVRFATREPATTIRSTLGLLNSAGFQEIFIYVLHPTARYEAANYPNVAMPTNLKLEPSAAERLGVVYNALFDLQLARMPSHVVTEYAWETAACGEPCPNAPLTLSEIMTLGGDLVEAELVPEPARHPDPGPETAEEKQQFAQRLQEKPSSERAAASRQHAADRRELARRRAVMGRQRYVLTRLHYRYDQSTRVTVAFNGAPRTPVLPQRRT